MTSPNSPYPYEKPHEFIRASVHCHQAGEFSEWMGVSRSSIEKWWREPESENSQAATGRRSFLELTDNFFDWLLSHQPARAVLFLKRYEFRLRAFRDGDLPGKPLTANEFRELLAQATLRTAETLAAIARDAEPPVLWREHGAAVTAVELLIERMCANDAA